MGTIYIPEPQQPTDYDISSYSLYVMKINVNRMEHMIKSGYYCLQYSDDEWKKFKLIKKSLE